MLKGRKVIWLATLVAPRLTWSKQVNEFRLGTLSRYFQWRN